MYSFIFSLYYFNFAQSVPVYVWYTFCRNRSTNEFPGALRMLSLRLRVTLYFCCPCFSVEPVTTKTFTIYLFYHVIVILLLRMYEYEIRIRSPKTFFRRYYFSGATIITILFIHK